MHLAGRPLSQLSQSGLRRGWLKPRVATLTYHTDTIQHHVQHVLHGCQFISPSFKLISLNETQQAPIGTMAKKTRIPHKFHPWINARKQFRLSDAHIQMARELGLSPKRFAKYADRQNQPWKLPLTECIDALYLKQFGKSRPDEVKTMEEIAAAHVAKRAARKQENAKVALKAETESENTEPENTVSESPPTPGTVTGIDDSKSSSEDTTAIDSEVERNRDIESSISPEDEPS